MLKSKVAQELLTCVSCGMKLRGVGTPRIVQRAYSRWVKSSERPKIRKDLNELDNAPKAERVYVWGCAATGALGRTQGII